MIEELRDVADWVWLVPALPLLAALTTGARVLLGRAAGDAGERLTARLTELAALTALLLLVLIDLAVIWHGPARRLSAPGLPPPTGRGGFPSCSMRCRCRWRR